MRTFMKIGFVLVSILGLGTTLRAEGPNTAAAPLYPVAHDAPLHGSERLDEDRDTYRRLRVEFDGIRKDRVPGYLYVPKSGPGKYPGVVLQYGSGGHKGTDYIVFLGRQFVQAGLVVLTIDSPGRGERGGKGKDQESFGDKKIMREHFAHYLSDYSRAVDYLVSRPEVDASRLAYVGISWGAITGIPFVAHDPRIKVMASIVGGSILVPSGGGELLYGSLDPAAQVGLIAPRPLLFMNVTKDQLVPRPYAEALHKAAGKGSKIVWFETDHYFHNVDKAKLGDEVIHFLKDGWKSP
jgi:dienelactone hydrolase